MRVPKPKHKGLTRQRLSSLDGVKDVSIGPASVDARRTGNAHVTGQGVGRDDDGFNDVEERRKKFGFLN